MLQIILNDTCWGYSVCFGISSWLFGGCFGGCSAVTHSLLVIRFVALEICGMHVDEIVGMLDATASRVVLRCFGLIALHMRMLRLGLKAEL